MTCSARTMRPSNRRPIDERTFEKLTKVNETELRMARAKKELGETSVIDLVGIIGYYGLVSVTLNAFELPLPDGEKLPFDIK